MSRRYSKQSAVTRENLLAVKVVENHEGQLVPLRGGLKNIQATLIEQDLGIS